VQHCPGNAGVVCAQAVREPFDIWCARISEQTIDMPSWPAYLQLRGVVAALYHGLRDTQPLVRPLCQLFWDLEYPIADRVDRLLPMEPGLTVFESQERLAVLDTERARFRQLLLTAFTGPIKAIGVRNLVIRWARIQYDCIHGFQAPATPDPARAVRDAMGLTDHFAELMDEILTQVDGVPPDRE